MEILMKYIVTGSGYTSQLVKDVPQDIQLISETDLKESELRFEAGSKVYAPTESALEVILEKSDDPAFIKAVDSLKDKVKFRHLMSNLYPDFFFKKIDVSELETVELDRTRKYIVKPVKGFFGTAVKEIKAETNLAEIAEEIKAELAENCKYFSESVLSKNELIIEEYIEGDEYAIDLFYNEAGEPEILNIYHHPFPNKNEYFHVLYYTNKQLFDQFMKPIKDLFVELNQHLNVTGFPIHAEFKLTDGKLIPIEMNPLRYGGFGLADLTYYGFKINPFVAFFRDEKMDWPKIWKECSNDTFGWILAYNGDRIDIQKMKPKHEEFKSLFGNILHYVEVDHKTNPVFGMAYVQNDSVENLDFLLNLEFNEFFE